MRQAIVGPLPPPLDSLPEIPEVAAAFPQLEILDLIGRGGMGVVYKARQRSLQRLVALKLLAPGHQADPGFTARFEREARALAELNHPHIVTVYDFGQSGGFYFLLMEYLDGVNLRQAMNAGRMTSVEALAIIPPICEALQFAHDRGIIHRDIKPENLLLDRQGRVKIADFGVARMLHETHGDGTAVVTSSVVDSNLTGSRILGTPAYMAPEQERSPTQSDHRADIYSLGKVLYELLTGELPGKHVEPISKRLQLDVRLDEVVLRALDTDPQQRYATAREFQKDLRAATQDRVRDVASGQWDHNSGLVAHGVSSAPLIRSGYSTLVTQDELKSFWTQFLLPRKQGILSLHPESLVHVGKHRKITIPLSAIEEIGVSYYSRILFPMGMRCLVVGVNQNGVGQRYVLSPGDHKFHWGLSAFNEGVLDWHDSILAEVTRVRGTPPLQLQPAEMRVPVHSGTLLAWLFPLAVLGLLGLGIFVFLIRDSRRVGPPRTTIFSPFELVSRPNDKIIDPASGHAIALSVGFEMNRVIVDNDKSELRLEFSGNTTDELILSFGTAFDRGPQGQLPVIAQSVSDRWNVHSRDVSPTLRWSLPAELAAVQREALRDQVALSTSRIKEIGEGAVVELGQVAHPDGWKIRCLVKVERKPGTPYPAPPAGALSTAEQHFSLPAASIVKITPSYGPGQGKWVQDSPIVFQLSPDSPGGLIVRCSLYAARGPSTGERAMLDFVDPDTRVTFFRIDRSFARRLVASNVDLKPLPVKGASIVLNEPGEFQDVTWLELADPIENPAKSEVKVVHRLKVEHHQPLSTDPPPQFRLPRRTAPFGERLEASPFARPAIVPHE